jgi:hypothetical protein
MFIYKNELSIKGKYLSKFFVVAFALTLVFSDSYNNPTL